MFAANNLSSRFDGVISFRVVSDDQNLPFPQNLDSHWRLAINTLLLIIFVHGTRLRLVIFSYIRSEESKWSPANVLFCLDQVNGLFLAMNFGMRIGYNTLNEPMSELLSPFACSCSEFISGLFISGTIVWRCCIAIFRVLYIKAQIWLTTKVGVSKLLISMVVFGVSQMILFSLVTVNLDKYSLSKRSCYRMSNYELEIINDYQVPMFVMHCGFIPKCLFGTAFFLNELPNENKLVLCMCHCKHWQVGRPRGRALKLASILCNKNRKLIIN